MFPPGTDTKQSFYHGMFDAQAAYLQHRLKREPWWGLDYGFANFTMFKAILKYASAPRLDLDEIPYRKLLAEIWAEQDGFKKPLDTKGFAESLWPRFGKDWMQAYPPFEQNNRKEFRPGCCFRYHYIEKTGVIDLHFMNAEEPNSPFENLNVRKEELRQIVMEIEAKRLPVQWVACDTWLNNIEVFRFFFPESYAASLTPAEEFPKGYGWWGQLVTRSGGLHSGKAEKLIREGRFEFARLLGKCPWDDFRNHLGI